MAQVFLLWRENKLWVFCFQPLWYSSFKWGVLEEPARHIATDSSRPPKPLVRIPDNLEGVMQKRPAPGWPESKHLPLSQPIQSHLRTRWENKQQCWKGHWKVGEGWKPWNIQGIIRMKGEKSSDHCTAWGIRGATLEKVLMEWRFEHPTHTPIRYPSYWHKQKWEKQNIIWLYFKLSL